MQISIAFLQDPSVTDTLKIMKRITKGKFKIYKAYSTSERERYAIKTFPNNALGTKQYNKEAIISELSHPNIIKYIPVAVNFDNDSDDHCIVTEWAKYGDAHEIAECGMFNSEILIRTFFHQIVAGLGYMHSQGVAHLDLKLENLMFGSGFAIKIIDFDQAQHVDDKDITSGGTEDYRAPEVIDGSCTDFRAADIYSLGIILYAMKTRHVPFAEVTVKDANRTKRTTLTHYGTFVKDNATFWKGKTAAMNDSTFFSREFKDLINGMLEFDISKRFTLTDIKKSKWFKGPIFGKEELRTEMKIRWQLFKRK